MSTEIIAADERGESEANPGKGEGGEGGKTDSGLTAGEHVCSKLLNVFYCCLLLQAVCD